MENKKATPEGATIQRNSTTGKRLTQCEKILRYIEDFGSITTYEAFTELDITRLASRIHDLTNQGYDFNKVNVSRKNRYGEVKHFIKYSLEER